MVQSQGKPHSIITVAITMGVGVDLCGQCRGHAMVAITMGVGVDLCGQCRGHAIPTDDGAWTSRSYILKALSVCVFVCACIKECLYMCS